MPDSVCFRLAMLLGEDGQPALALLRWKHGERLFGELNELTSLLESLFHRHAAVSLDVLAGKHEEIVPVPPARAEARCLVLVWASKARPWSRGQNSRA